MAKKLVALAYGSNLGDREGNIFKALELLRKFGFEVDKVSESVESEPVDCTPGSGIFLNGAITGKWSSSAMQLLKLCQNVENVLGRETVREINSPRPIDLDILLFDEEIIEGIELTVPHPRMLVRDFVMLPLNEIASDWVIPGSGCTVAEVARNFQ